MAERAAKAGDRMIEDGWTQEQCETFLVEAKRLYDQNFEETHPGGWSEVCETMLKDTREAIEYAQMKERVLLEHMETVA